MKNSGLIIVGLVAAAAVALSATNAIKPNYDPVNKVAVDAVACIDYDPPNTGDQVTYKGATYSLIKINAGISESKIKEDMKKVGVANGGKANGLDMYVVPEDNDDGDPLGENYIYLDTKKKEKNLRVFSVYIKDGFPIPDFVRNCKAKGGSRQSVDYWRDSQFPPSAFNQVDVTDGTLLEEPGYIYSGVKGTFNQLNQRGGIEASGTLFVQERNKSFPLYYHLGTVFLVDGNDTYEYLPTQQPLEFSSQSKENLQLKWFTLVDTPVYSWFTPDCKPAVYLYPTQTQQTSVRVDAKGPLTLTIPQYPQNGWNVVAEPDGTIHSDGKQFPYLYYEAKIPDNAFSKPTNGYVVSYNELDGLYGTVLPQLGLNAKETADFKEYWNKYLPFSPYYFVGVMPVAQVDEIEKLTISPQPETTIRVRVYFEPLKERKVVDAPVVAKQTRSGFTAVEWGGMVKLDKDSNFTCSQ